MGLTVETPEQTDLRHFGCVLSLQLSYSVIILLAALF